MSVKPIEMPTLAVRTAISNESRNAVNDGYRPEQNTDPIEITSLLIFDFTVNLYA